MEVLYFTVMCFKGHARNVIAFFRAGDDEFVTLHHNLMMNFWVRFTWAVASIEGNRVYSDAILLSLSLDLASGMLLAAFKGFIASISNIRYKRD